MPTVKDKITNKTISEQPYTEEGQQIASNIAAGNPNWEIEYAPGGSYDAMNRSVVDYAGGGNTGYNEIGRPPMMYKEGGKVEDEDVKIFGKSPDELKEIGKKVKSKIKGLAGKLKGKLKKKSKSDKTASVIQKEVKRRAKKGKKEPYVKIPKGVDVAKVKTEGKIPSPKKTTSVTLTEGGAYPTYKKKSKPAKSFKSAFRAARVAGKDTFMWNDRKYTTELK